MKLTQYTGYRLIITGTVQGVGFRPYIWQLARQEGYGGTVRNDGRGVIIELFKSPPYSPTELTRFCETIRAGLPPLASIDTIDINDRRWSHYIAGAEALINNYPTFRDAARKQIDERTANFLEAHDLKTYVAANRREWHDLHEMLSGRKMNPAECLPYVFDKLVE